MDDKTVQAAAAKVKRENKVIFANYLQKATGQVIDPRFHLRLPGQAYARVQAPAPERPEHRR